MIVPVVATHPIQFMAETDFRAHEAKTCIADGYVLGRPDEGQNYIPLNSTLKMSVRCRII